MSERGVFITFEGGEGCGKSTQLAVVAEHLRSGGASVLALREPGGTVVGEVVRELLLDPSHESMNEVAELMLYEASRAQLVAEVIEPALRDGLVVLCDRFTDSTTAYQGYGRGLPLEAVGSLNSLATGGLVPTRTVLLDLDAVEGLRRATAAATDRLEGLDEGFHARVRAGFRAIAAEHPARVRVVDAAGDQEEVAARVIDALRDLPVLAKFLA